jgi:hypothetical protein
MTILQISSMTALPVTETPNSNAAVKFVKTFQTNSIYPAICKRINQYLEHQGGPSRTIAVPFAIVVGSEIHGQSLEQDIYYVTRYAWQTSGRQREAEILVVLSMQVKEFLLIPGVLAADHIADDFDRLVRNDR